ncbi:MAG: flagellar protein FlgN [Steroidobacteraceae bacterium]
MNPAASSRIEQLLDRQIELAHALAAVLEAERDALTGTSPELVSEKASEKVRLLEQFERLEQERRQLCTQAGMPPMEAGSQSGASRAFAQRWKSLMGLLAHCRNANETNGLILNLKQGQVRQLLDILRGGPAITYGPNGQTFAAAVRPIARV